MKDSTIRLSEQYTLTVQEASKLFRIGQRKLYQLIQENPNADFILMNGNRALIKRRLFEEYIDRATTI